jgi:hypothetical protein
MNFKAFNNPIFKLAPFLQSSCLNPTRPQLTIRKIMTIVVYLFLHGLNVTHMVNWLNLGASTIRKYVYIVCDVLINKNKMFGKYISIPYGQIFKGHHCSFWKFYRII